MTVGPDLGGTSGGNAGGSRGCLLAILALAAACLWPAAARAQGIRHINTAGNTGPTDASKQRTLSKTVAVGTNNYLLVAVAIDTITTAATVSGVTFNGVALSSLGAATRANTCRMELWHLVNPTADGVAHNVVVTLSHASINTATTALNFTGVHQTTPTRTFAGANGATSPASVAVASANGELVVEGSCTANATSATAGVGARLGSAGTGQTSTRHANAGSLAYATSYDDSSGNSSETMSWTVTGSDATGWAIAGISLKPANATAIALQDFTVARAGARTKLQWQTGFEVESLGFHLYREAGGARSRLTAGPIIAGSLLDGTAASTRGHAYSWQDTLAADPGDGARYWLEEIDLRGGRSWHGPARPVAFAPEAGVKWTAVQQQVDVGLADGPPAPPFAPPPILAGADESPIQQALAGAPAVKIGVDRDGWYQLGQPELIAAGLDPGVDPRRLALHVEGRELPLVVHGEEDGRFDPGDSIEFHGRALNALATATRVYWLTGGERPGRRVLPAPVPTGPSGAPRESFLGTVESRPRTTYFAALANGDENNFFGPLLTTTPLTQRLRLRHPARGAAAEGLAAWLEVGLQGVSWASHAVSVEVDGKPLGTIELTDRERRSARFALAAPFVENGELAVTLRGLKGEDDATLLEYVRVEHPRGLIAEDGRLHFSAPGGRALHLSGFLPRELVQVFDVTDEEEVMRVSTGPADAAGRVMIVVPAAGTRSLIARAATSVEQVRTLAPNRPSRWSAAQTGGDLLVLGPRQLLSPLTPWQRLREAEGYSVVTVDVEDVFDELSFGAKHPDAIRTFIARARARWARPPRAILLVGDASLDPRQFLGQGDGDLLPTKLLDTTYLETASDDWFADEDGDGIADVPVGRLPVRTPAELAMLVNRLVAAPTFTSRAAAVAAGPLVFVRDRNDPSNDFARVSRSLREGAAGPFRAIEIVRGESAPEDPQQALRRGLRERAPFISYVGHGSQAQWAGKLVASDALAVLDAEGPGAFWSALTCLNGFFQDPYQPSLAEALLAHPRAGAVGVWASSGVHTLELQAEMGQAFARNLLLAGMTAGEAARQAKHASSSMDVRRTWILFGDPAWRLFPLASGDGVDAGSLAGEGTAGAGLPDAGPSGEAGNPAPPSSGACHCGALAGGGPPGAAGLLAVLLVAGLLLRRRQRG